MDVPCHGHVPEGKSLWWTFASGTDQQQEESGIQKQHQRKTSVKDPGYNFSLGQSYHPCGDSRAFQGYPSIPPNCRRLSTHRQLCAKRQNLSLWSPRALLFTGNTEHEPGPSQRQAPNKQRPTIGSRWCPWFSLRTKGRKWIINSQRNSSTGRAQRWKTALTKPCRNVLKKMLAPKRKRRLWWNFVALSGRLEPPQQFIYLNI